MDVKGRNEHVDQQETRHRPRKKADRQEPAAHEFGQDDSRSEQPCERHLLVEPAHEATHIRHLVPAVSKSERDSKKKTDHEECKIRAWRIQQSLEKVHKEGRANIRAQNISELKGFAEVLPENVRSAMVWSKWHLGWPWFCLGSGLALFVVIFCTNSARSRPGISRWWDPVWLSWLVVPMLMVHMFEEYGIDVLGRTYLLPETICKTFGYPPYPDCPTPTAHYPLLNLGFALASAPLAAFFARRNLVIGLSVYGMLIFNGIGHVAGTLAGGLQGGSGVLTGALFFIPSFFWMVYVVLKSHELTATALAVSVSGGIIAHILLVLVLALQKVGLYGPTGVLTFDLVVIATPLLVSWTGSRFLAPMTARTHAVV